MLKKIGLGLLFLLLCVSLSYGVMSTTDIVSDKIRNFYNEENQGGGSELGSSHLGSGRTISERRLEEPVTVDEYLPWFAEPFTGIGVVGDSLLDNVKKYAIEILLPLVAVIFLICIHRYRKKKREKEMKITSATIKDKLLLMKDHSNENSGTNMSASLEEINEIRRIVRDWERQLNFLARKKANETIQEWFERINGPVEIIPIYEKVRYGEKISTKQELLYLRKVLK
ncbi:hypothetical protein JOC86_004279 [Bacillus pakistanensis]|uniref:Uncharacterized protein n=1 Tax=Rossellomorea pakistanensis TaxID=992288 RepID=A0ABS2NIP4_9BACI|nr:hypothetical protein [Bacillus pakistanensis]MBM7587705.1 hypothetical protein [Bacillus pakistanensis]